MVVPPQIDQKYVDFATPISKISQKHFGTRSISISGKSTILSQFLEEITMMDFSSEAQPTTSIPFKMFILYQQYFMPIFRIYCVVIEHLSTELTQNVGDKRQQKKKLRTCTPSILMSRTKSM